MSFLLNNTRNMLENRLNANRHIGMIQQSARVGLLNPFPEDGGGDNMGFANANFGGFDFRDMYMHDRPTAFSRPYNNGVDMGRQNQAPYEGMSDAGRRRVQDIDNGSVPNRSGDGLLYRQPDGTYKPFLPGNEPESTGSTADDGLPPPIPARIPKEAYGGGSNTTDTTPDALNGMTDAEIEKFWQTDPEARRVDRQLEEKFRNAGIGGSSDNGYSPPTSSATGYPAFGGGGPFGSDSFKMSNADVNRQARVLPPLANPYKTTPVANVANWIQNHLPQNTLKNLATYGLTARDLFRFGLGGIVGSDGFKNSDNYKRQPGESARAAKWRAMNNAFNYDEPFGLMERRMTRGTY